MSPAAPTAPPIADTLKEYGRGMAGGLLFSLPLLYTMEVWWTGFTASPLRLLAFVLLTFGLLLLYNRYAGMHEDATFGDVVLDSFEEMALGVALSAGVLWMLGRLRPDDSPSEMIGKIIVEAMIAAIGVSVGTAQLGEGVEGQEERGNSFGGQIAIAFCGAFLVAANVAPTEEILLIAVESDPLRLLCMVAFSLMLATVILVHADFRQSRPFDKVSGIPHGLFTASVTYLVALVTSAVLLYIFGRFGGVGTGVAVAQVVVLSLPAVLGASAGRLLIQ
ncbi:MAG: TIGR02587 family membrane protein [Fimbriimonas sp.]